MWADIYNLQITFWWKEGKELFDIHFGSILSFQVVDMLSGGYIKECMPICLFAHRCEDQIQTLLFFANCSSLHFLTNGLSLSLESTDWIDWEPVSSMDLPVYLFSLSLTNTGVIRHLFITGFYVCTLLMFRWYTL